MTKSHSELSDLTVRLYCCQQSHCSAPLYSKELWKAVDYSYTDNYYSYLCFFSANFLKPLIRLSFSSLFWASYLSYQLSAPQHLTRLIIPFCLQHFLYMAPKARHAHDFLPASLATPLLLSSAGVASCSPFPRAQSSGFFSHLYSFSGQTLFHLTVL